VELYDIVDVADRLGIIAFAVSGVAVGIRARLDLYGLLALGLVTAIGGGVTRDIMLGDIPRTLLITDYLLYATGTSVLAIVAGVIGWDAPGPVMRTADAVGTGAFAVTGALLAREAGLEWPAGIVLAIITATGGGILRDVLAREVPRVLHAELNATAAAAGGLVAVLLAPERLDVAAVAGASVAALISGAGHVGLIRLPALTREE